MSLYLHQILVGYLKEYVYLSTCNYACYYVCCIEHMFISLESLRKSIVDKKKFILYKYVLKIVFSFHQIYVLFILLTANQGVMMLNFLYQIWFLLQNPPNSVLTCLPCKLHSLLHFLHIP